MKPRYAIYHAPSAESPLWRFGTGVLGYDAAKAIDAPFSPRLAALPDWPELTAEPRRYGFHATLKAPLELDEAFKEQDLLDAVQTFSSLEKPILGPLLEVSSLGRFLALTPIARVSRVHDLADKCVRDFDRFRTPLSDADRVRRHASGLTPRQADQLERFGYPYVFEDFRFHMTLTGPLPAERIESVRSVLSELYKGVESPLLIDSLCVFRQDQRDGRFRIIHRAPFRG